MLMGRNNFPSPLTLQQTVPTADAAMPMTALEYAAAVVYSIYGHPEDGADLWD